MSAINGAIWHFDSPLERHEIFKSATFDKWFIGLRGITREGLYKYLSADGNPSLGTVPKVVKALGLKLTPRIAERQFDGQDETHNCLFLCRGAQSFAA